MKKFLEAVLAPHKHMSKKASPYHAHSQGLVYTPKGKEEVRPIDTADAGYGGEAVADAEGGEANAGKASKKAVSPMKMQTLVKANEGFDSSPADIAKMLVAKHGKNVTKDHIKALEQDRDSHSGLDHDEIMKHVKKLQEETERERLMKLRSFAFKNREKGLGKAMMEDEQIDELKKSTLASYAKKATDDVSYHSFTAGTMSSKDPERLAQDKKAMKRQTGVIKAIDRLAKEEVEQVDEAEYVPTQRSNFTGKRHLKRDHSDELGSRYVFSTDPAKMKKSYSTEKGQKNAANRNVANLKATIKSSLGKHSKPNLPEEAEQVDEGSKRMSAAVKLQRAFDREKAASDASRKRGEEMLAQARAEYAKKQAAKTNEEVELDERNMENKAKKDNVVRQIGTHAYIKHGADAGAPYFSSKMTGRKVMSDPKFKSSKVADMYRKLPSMKEENNGTEADEGEYGYEGDMAMSQLKSIIRNAKGLHDLLEPQTDLPEWVQSKITLAADYIQTAADYWRSEKEEAVNEGKMKDMATNKAEDKRLAAHAADVLGGPVRKKEGPPGKKPLGARLAASAARRAMKSVSEKKMSKVPRVGEMEMTLEEYIDI